MNWRSFFLSWFYAALLSGAALSCPATAFEISVSLPVLWLVCAAASGLFALLWHLPAQGLTLSCAALAYGAALWRFRQPVAEGFSAAVEAVTGLYARAYPGLQAISLLPEAASADATLCFAALAIPLAALLLWTITRQTPVWLTLLLCAPWLGMCMVVVDQLPALWALLLLLSGCLLLALTRDSRRTDLRAGGRLTAVLILPVLLLTAGLAWLQPPQDYVRADWPDALRERINRQITALSGMEFDPGGALQWQTETAPEQLWTAEHDQVDLSRLGERRNSGITVLELYGETTGRVYLRGASLTEYSGNAWHAAALSTPTDPLEQGQAAAQSLRIRTRRLQPLLYTPYYPVEVGGSWLNDEYYYNTDGLTDYSVGYRPDPIQEPGDGNYRGLVYTAYCQLPEATAEALLAIAEEAGLTALPVEAQPDAVADFVRGAARYSLSPEPMPAGADFPVWFLTGAEEGYCVHFATATATMLRALGIPARYVTGFMANARADRWVEVTDRDAHAWVEYWRDDLGWVPLESTPGDSRSSGTLIELPDEPEPPDEPTVPDEPTPAPEPDPPAPEQKPEQPERPAQPDNPAGIQPDRSRARLGWVLIALAVLAALVGSRWLRLWLRQRQRRGTANEQALVLWRQMERLARHAGLKLPQRLETLARKARFSQHQLSSDELEQFYSHAEALTEHLRRQSGLWRRFRNRWLWADC